MSTPLKVAIAGFGHMGRIHARNVKLNPSLELSALVTHSPDARALSPFVYDNLQDAMLECTFDCIIISTASPTHADLVIEVVDAGLVVFFEKPIAFTSADIARLLSLSPRDQSRVRVDYNRRFDPDRLTQKHAIASNQLGAIEFINITSRDPYFLRDKFSLSNALLNTISHDLDAIEWLTGDEIRFISASIGNLSGDSHPPIVVQVVTRSGILGCINVSFNSVYGYDQRIEVSGTKGMMIADNPRPSGLAFFNATGEHRSKLFDYYDDRYASTFRDELAEFQRIVTTTQANTICATLLEGCRASKSAIAALASINSGYRSEIPPSSEHAA